MRSSPEIVRTSFRHSESPEAVAARYVSAMPKTPDQQLTVSLHKEFVGRQLMLAREALGMTHAALAREYGMKASNRLNQWEAGHYYPDPWFLKQLCDDKGFTMDWFYRGLKAGVSDARAADLRRVEAGMSEASAA